MRKPKLKCTVETVTLVDYNDFQQFVRKVYPPLKKWEYVCAMECGNDTSHQFTVRPGARVDEKEWVEGVTEYPVEMSPYSVFDKLAEDGHIQPGKYIVKVSW